MPTVNKTANDVARAIEKAVKEMTGSELDLQICMGIVRAVEHAIESHVSPLRDAQAALAGRGEGEEDKREIFFDIDGEERCAEEQALSILLEHEVLFCNTAINPKTVCLYVLCNDIFAWALADAEDFTTLDISPLYKLWEKNHIWGPVKWVCMKRNQKPQRPVEKSMREAGAWDEDMEALPPNIYDENCKKHRAAAQPEPAPAQEKEGSES